MASKHFKIVPYLFQLIVLTSVFGGIGYILAKYFFKVTNENLELLIFMGFEFLGVVIFAYLNDGVAIVCLNYLKINKKQIKLILQNFLFILLAFSFITIISYSLGIISVRGIIELNNLKIILYFVLALTIALCEEIIFRGFIALYVYSLINKKFALYISSLLFAMSHVQYDSIFPFVTAILAGLIFALLTFKNRSLYPAIAFHMAWDFSYFLFNDIFLVEMEIKIWGELFEVPQIVLLILILFYLLYSNHINKLIKSNFR